MSTALTQTICECNDTSEKIDLSIAHNLYIKPIARLNISIQLPPPKTPGQSATVLEIIDNIKKQSLPDEYVSLKVIKSSLDFIRLEGEIENKSSLKALLPKLEGTSIRMPAYTDVLKVRAAEAKIIYPTRHDWDTYYLVAQNVNEMKPGERPDTIHIQDVPSKWFSERKTEGEKPSENVIREVFSIFGEIRTIDIPISANTLTGKPLTFFEAYIQYKDYISFVKAMDTFRGMKLLFIENNDTRTAFTMNIKVDFDRGKYLSDKEIQKRSIDKLKNIEIEKIKNAQLEKEKEKIARKNEIEKYQKLLLEETAEATNATSLNEQSKEQRRKEREEARRQKRLAKKQQEEERKLSMKIAVEERKILIAQRKLESMRLLEELFNRVKVIIAQEELKKREQEVVEEKQKQIEEEKAEQERKMKEKIELQQQQQQQQLEQQQASQNADVKKTIESSESLKRADREDTVKYIQEKPVKKMKLKRPLVT